MGLSVWQLAIIAVVILVLFGRGRISEMMGDFGKGIKSFNQGMNDDEAKEAKRLGHDAKPASEAGDGQATGCFRERAETSKWMTSLLKQP